MNVAATQYHLNELVAKTNSEKAIISSFNGLTMFSTSENTDKEDLISALSTTLFSISKKIVARSNSDRLNQICLQNDKGSIFIKVLSENSYLTLFTNHETDLITAKKELDATISMINAQTPVAELV